MEGTTMILADTLEIKQAMIGSDLSKTARLVLLAIMDFTNKARECFPAVATLMQKCDCCERTVRSKIKELVEKGWLIKKERFRNNGSQTSNLYVIQIPQPSKMMIEEEQDHENISYESVKYEDPKAALRENIKLTTKEIVGSKLCIPNEKKQKKEALLQQAVLPMTSTMSITNMYYDTIGDTKMSSVQNGIIYNRQCNNIFQLYPFNSIF